MKMGCFGAERTQLVAQISGGWGRDGRIRGAREVVDLCKYSASLWLALSPE